MKSVTSAKIAISIIRVFYPTVRQQLNMHGDRLMS